MNTQWGCLQPAGERPAGKLPDKRACNTELLTRVAQGGYKGELWLHWAGPAVRCAMLRCTWRPRVSPAEPVGFAKGLLQEK